MRKIRTKAGNNSFLKEYNKKIILNIIRTNKTISRADISHQTGLSATAVGGIVESLIQEGYIYEIGSGQSSGGRKPVLLSLKPKSFYSIGIDLDVDTINVLLMDITGDVIDKTNHANTMIRDCSKLSEIILPLVNAILYKNNINVSKLLGLGISVPGLIDIEGKTVIMAPNLGWNYVDIVDVFKEILNIPVYIENEAKCSAICENWVGQCIADKDFVCINIKTGIGAGIFTSGKLYRGASGTAGEVGHIVVDEGGTRCGCGNYGCLETVASTPSIIKRCIKYVKQGVVSSLNNIEHIENVTIDDIVSAALQQDSFALNLLNESARYIGIAVSNIVNTLNPSKVVLGKDFCKYAEVVMDVIKGVVKTKAIEYASSEVDVVASNIGQDSSAMGAAIIPVKKLFGK